MSRCAAFVGLALALLSPGCAPPRPPSPALAIIAEARKSGLSVVDPLDLDPAVIAEVQRAVPLSGSPELRLRTLLSYLLSRGYVNFQYTPGRSLTAREAYRERRGDCMAYAHLFSAIARRLGLPTYFVHVTEVRSYYERGGWFFASSHIAVGHGQGPNTLVLDLTGEISDWKLAFYERIDDAEALALYYNNVAVDLMTTGRVAEAERMFRFFLHKQPRVVELHNNLGVLLNRSGRHREALAVLAGGVSRFPRYEPLYTNAIRAARGLDRADIAAWYERRGREIGEGDPFLLFARAIAHFERSEFGLAAGAFARAVEGMPGSTVILAWLVRARLAAGQLEEAREAFGRARRVARDRDARLLRELLEKHPELGDPRPDP